LRRGEWEAEERKGPEKEKTFNIRRDVCPVTINGERVYNGEGVVSRNV